MPLSIQRQLTAAAENAPDIEMIERLRPADPRPPGLAAVSADRFDLNLLEQ